ncbi:MAG TPA: T9SS type A sorting domain-containing protein [bacterium]|nr:T9SS type A sorting domain-containing protein [bacterium]HPN43567.1 T9SS type A sorting domain-containing protein [bacterium]
MKNIACFLVVALLATFTTVVAQHYKSSEIADGGYPVGLISATSTIIECETMAMKGMMVHDYAGASNGLVVKFNPITGPGWVKTDFTRPSGIYNLTVRYLDEWDGICTAELYINEVLKHTWKWDDITTGNFFVEYNLGNYYLVQNDVIKIQVTRQGDENGRLDYLKITDTESNYWKGVIPDDITWTQAKSPYVISGDVTIPDTVTLTIESGVDVIFLNSDSLKSGNDTTRAELIVNGGFVTGSADFIGLAGDSIGAFIDFNKDITLANYADINCSQYSILIFDGNLVIDNNTELDIGHFSIITFNDSTLITRLSELTFKPHCTIFFNDDCIVDKTSELNIRDESVVRIAPDVLLKSFGRFWAHETTFRRSLEGTWLGIWLEGSGASKSFFSECQLMGSVDGFTIVNSSPAIKLCIIHNMIKRGINIKGASAKPFIDRNYIYLCGTYPIQIVNGANPTVYDNKFHSNHHAAIRIWNADGFFGRNEIWSRAEGVFIYGSTSNAYFYACNDDDDGNIFDLAHIGKDGVVIEGGVHMFGQVSAAPVYHGRNIFRNRDSYYYIRNNTPNLVMAEDNYWPGGLAGAFLGSVDSSPESVTEPVNAGPSWRRPTSPYSAGIMEYNKGEYLPAFNHLKLALTNYQASTNADLAVFTLAKAAIAVDSLYTLEELLDDLTQSGTPQVQHQARNWLSYFYTVNNDIKKAEKIALAAPTGTTAERAELLALVTYYNSKNDKNNANRIANLLRAHQADDFIEEAIFAAFENEIELPKLSKQMVETTGEDVVEPTSSSIYPNPFNSTTTISYNVKEAAHVNITIFDILGRRVTTLVDYRNEAGLHNVNWEGTSEFGNPVASGIYFIRITINNKTQLHKVSLLK